MIINEIYLSNDESEMLAALVTDGDGELSFQELAEELLRQAIADRFYKAGHSLL